MPPLFFHPPLLSDAVMEELDVREKKQEQALAELDQLALELQRRLGGTERQVRGGAAS